MQACLAHLQRDGLLLKTDTRFPNVASLVAGERVRGTWWAHPAAHDIFRELEALAGHPDVVFVKLVAGKDTLVHRRLWPELLAVATSHERWQFEMLSTEARRLYDEVTRMGEKIATGPLAKALETRLLVHGEQFHSERGNHTKRLESWRVWAERMGAVALACPPAAEARQTFEAILPGARWPWHG